MILAVFTGLTERGGIQQYGKHAAAVIAMRARERGENYLLLGLNDPPGEHQLETAGVPYRITGFGRNKWRMLAAAFRNHHDATVVYLNHPNLAPLGALIRARGRAVRVVVSTYGIDVWHPLPSLWRLGLKSADVVTALAEFSAARVVDCQGVAKGRIALVPCTLDPELCSGRAGPLRPHAGGDGLTLLTVARLMREEHREQKGIDCVIRALAEVRKSVPDAHYVVVGDGDDRPRLEQLAREFGVGGRVTFTGALGDAELRDCYRACDVFVMPSRSEGFGIVFLEAMALGKPVIGGNHGGTPEIWRDGTAGYLVEHGDVAALADRIVRLLSDHTLRAQMGAAGREIVANRYSFNHFCRNFSAALNGA